MINNQEKKLNPANNRCEGKKKPFGRPENLVVDLRRKNQRLASYRNFLINKYTGRTARFLERDSAGFDTTALPNGLLFLHRSTAYICVSKFFFFFFF